MYLQQTKKSSVFLTFLSIYLFLIPFDFFPVIKGVSISRFLIFLPILGALTEIARFKWFNRNAFALVRYLIAVAITYFYTIEPALTNERIMSVLLNVFVILFLSIRRYSNEELKQLFRAVAFSGWLAMALTLLYGRYRYGRLEVFFGETRQDPNYFCGFLLLPICYYLWLYLAESKASNLIFAVILAIPVLFTGSRGGLIALLAGVVLLFLFNIKGHNHKGYRAVIAIASIALVTLLLWNYLPDEIVNRFSVENAIESKGSGRFDIWEDIWANYKEADLPHKIFGYGAATVKNFNERNQVAHNIYLETLIEMGLFGCLLIFSMYIKYGRMALKSSEKFLFAAFIGYMVMAASMSLYSYKPIWNILFLIIITYTTEFEREKI